jgi:hypothetical protein
MFCLSWQKTTDMFCLSWQKTMDMFCLSDRRPRICSVCLTEDHGYVLFVRQKTTDMFCWSDRRPRICSVGLTEDHGYVLFVWQKTTDMSCLSDRRPRICSVGLTEDHGYVLFVVVIIQSFLPSWLITGFWTRVTRRVPLVNQGLHTFPKHLSSPPLLVGFVLLNL